MKVLRITVSAPIENNTVEVVYWGDKDYSEMLVDLRKGGLNSLMDTLSKMYPGIPKTYY